MKKLLKLEKELRKARAELEKQATMLGDGSETMSAGSSMVNTAKSEDGKSSLKGKQHKLDADGDGDIEADDLAALRQKKKKKSDLKKARVFDFETGEAVADFPHETKPINREQRKRQAKQAVDTAREFNTNVVQFPRQWRPDGESAPPKHKSDTPPHIPSHLSTVGPKKNWARPKPQDGLDKAEHSDEKEDKKLIARALDRHNEQKHGEPKNKNSAFKKADSEKVLAFPNKASSPAANAPSSKPKISPLTGKPETVKSPNRDYFKAIGLRKSSEQVSALPNGQWVLGEVESSEDADTSDN